jgi:hypothetical protein
MVYYNLVNMIEWLGGYTIAKFCFILGSNLYFKIHFGASGITKRKVLRRSGFESRFCLFFQSVSTYNTKQACTIVPVPYITVAAERHF